MAALVGAPKENPEDGAPAAAGELKVVGAAVAVLPKLKPDWAPPNPPSAAVPGAAPNVGFAVVIPKVGAAATFHRHLTDVLNQIQKIITKHSQTSPFSRWSSMIKYKNNESGRVCRKIMTLLTLFRCIPTTELKSRVSCFRGREIHCKKIVWNWYHSIKNLTKESKSYYCTWIETHD